MGIVVLFTKFFISWIQETLFLSSIMKKIFYQSNNISSFANLQKGKSRSEKTMSNLKLDSKLKKEPIKSLHTFQS